jgi:hypothetical protein
MCSTLARELLCGLTIVLFCSNIRAASNPPAFATFLTGAMCLTERERGLKLS